MTLVPTIFLKGNVSEHLLFLSTFFIDSSLKISKTISILVDPFADESAPLNISSAALSNVNPTHLTFQTSAIPSTILQDDFGKLLTYVVSFSNSASRSVYFVLIIVAILSASAYGTDPNGYIKISCKSRDLDCAISAVLPNISL